MRVLKFSTVLAASGTAVSFPGATALADAGVPRPWQLGFQDMVTPAGVAGAAFHDLLLVVITVITVFVLGLLIFVMIRFNAKSNPTPTKTTHNTLLEVAWTVVPIIILVILAVPSFKLLYLQDVVPKPDMTIKAVGHQWYWSYEYPDHGNFSFAAYMVPESELKDPSLRLLDTDTEVVVPVNTTIQVLVTADDVLHAWAVPSLYVKMDAVPGRINATWFKATQEGTFYGQCSELCGKDHGFMPIKVRVVSKQAFEDWLKWAKKEYAQGEPGRDTKVARR